MQWYHDAGRSDCCASFAHKMESVQLHSQLPRNDLLVLFTLQSLPYTLYRSIHYLLHLSFHRVFTSLESLLESFSFFEGTNHIQQNLWGWESRLWNVHRLLKAPSALVGSPARALGAPPGSHSSVPRPPPHTPWVQTERGTRHGSRVSATDSAPREKGLQRQENAKKEVRNSAVQILKSKSWCFVCEHVSFAFFSPCPHTCIRDWYLLDLAAVGTDGFGFCPRD